MRFPWGGTIENVWPPMLGQHPEPASRAPTSIDFSLTLTSVSGIIRQRLAVAGYLRSKKRRADDVFCSSAFANRTDIRFAAAFARDDGCCRHLACAHQTVLGCALVHSKLLRRPNMSHGERWKYSKSILAQLCIIDLVHRLNRIEDRIRIA